MSLTPEQQARIANWNPKIDVCRELLGRWQPGDLTDLVLRKSTAVDAAGKAKESLRKGSKPTAGSPIADFWEALPDVLPMRPGTTGTFLEKCTIAGFINRLMNEDDRQIAKAVLSSTKRDCANAGGNPEQAAESGQLAAKDRECVKFIQILLKHTKNVETVEDGYKVRRIDQKHYYLDPSAATNWFNVVSSTYPTYEYCRNGLSALCEGDLFKASLASAKPQTAVMLTGGGAPSKDLLLMPSLLTNLEAGHSLHYYLMDISFYMLRDSLLWLCEHAPHKFDFQRISLTGIHGDVLSMTEEDGSLFHENGPALFAITGGTIGNLSERSFFRSLNQASRPGDLLIMSADILEEQRTVAPDELAEPYKTPEFRAWLKPVVTKVLHAAGSPEDVEKALKRVQYPVLSSVADEISNITGTYSVAVTLDINRKTITLFTSARYIESKLVGFGKTCGWNLLGVQPSPSPKGQHFKQFLFQRKKPE